MCVVKVATSKQHISQFIYKFTEKNASCPLPVIHIKASFVLIFFVVFISTACELA